MLYFYCKDMSMQLALMKQPQLSMCLNYTRLEVIFCCSVYVLRHMDTQTY